MNRTVSLPNAEMLRAPARRRTGLRALLAAFADGVASLADVSAADLRARSGRFLRANPSAGDARALRGDFEVVIGRYEPLLPRRPRPDGEAAP